MNHYKYVFRGYYKWAYLSFIFTIQTVLAPLPAGAGRHVAPSIQHHHKLPTTFPWINQLLTVYQGVHITYITTTIATSHPRISPALYWNTGPAKTSSIIPSYAIEHGTSCRHTATGVTWTASVGLCSMAMLIKKIIVCNEKNELIFCFLASDIVLLGFFILPTQLNRPSPYKLCFTRKQH